MKRAEAKSRRSSDIVLPLMILLIIYTPTFVFGASGGRMGGSSFRSSSSRSSSSFSHRPKVYSTFHHHDRVPPSPDQNRAPASAAHSSNSDGFDGFAIVILVLVVVIALVLLCNFMPESQRTSIIKLQVCLFSSVKSMQKDLDEICESADTSSRIGWKYLLKGTTKALVKREDSWVDEKNTLADVEACYEEISTEEYVKFDKPTLFNVDNIKFKTTRSLKDLETGNGYIVVTILVAAEGKHVLPSIKCSNDLRTSLENLGSIPTKEIKGVEVLWTPQQENDRLSEEELHEDYPLLKMITVYDWNRQGMNF